MLNLLLLTSAFSLTTVLSAPTGATCQTGEIISGTTCTQECNTDRYGGDINSLQAASFQDCALACSQDDRCLTAQFNNDNGYCYLKSALNGPQDSRSVDGVVCRQPAAVPTPTPSPGSCPTGATYTASNGIRFEYSCGLDYYGGDLRTVYGVSTIEACLEECGSEPLCLKSTWHKDSSVCYLKNGETGENSKAGDWSGKRVASPTTTTTSTTSSTTSTTTTTTTTTTTPAPTTTTTTTTTTSSTTTTTSKIPIETFTLRVVETNRKVSSTAFDDGTAPFIYENSDPSQSSQPPMTLVLPVGGGVPTILGQPDLFWRFSKYSNDFGHVRIPKAGDVAYEQQPMTCIIDENDLFICTATFAGQSVKPINEWIQCQPTNPYIHIASADSMFCGNRQDAPIVHMKAYRV